MLKRGAFLTNSENNSHPVPKQKGQRNGFWLFLLSMVISFCILGSAFLIFLYYTRANGVVEEKQDVPYISEYHPSIEENMTLLFLGCETPESSPELILLFKYNAPKGTIHAVSLPPSLLCETTNGRLDTIQGQYDYAGIGGGVEALELTLGLKIDRYIRAQRLGISNLADFLGGVPYKLAHPRDIGDETLMAGEQLLDGRRLTALFFADASEEALVPDTKLQAELLSILISGGLKSFSPTRYSSLSTALFYNCETSMSQYDFALRQEGFLNSIKKESLKTNTRSLQGTYNSDYTSFYPNEQSLKEIKEFLK